MTVNTPMCVYVRVLHTLSINTRAPSQKLIYTLECAFTVTPAVPGGVKCVFLLVAFFHWDALFIVHSTNANVNVREFMAPPLRCLMYNRCLLLCVCVWFSYQKKNSHCQQSNVITILPHQIATFCAFALHWH